MGIHDIKTNKGTRDAVLITGASSGIGLELARIFAKHKHDLVLVARREKRLREVADTLIRQYAVSVQVIPADLSASEAPQRIHKEVLALGLDIGILVNNAGFGNMGRFDQIDPARELALVQVNVAAMLHLSHLFIGDFMGRGGGRILNVSSVTAFSPGPLMSNYYASKAYGVSLSLGLREELKKLGICVCVLCPGVTLTEFFDSAEMSNSGLSSGRLSGVMTAQQVAEKAYQGLMANKALIVPGFKNKCLVFLSRIFSRRLAGKLSKQLNKSR